jgi:hypothetical protein
MALRSDRIADFTTDGFPATELLVTLLCEDHVGTYIVPYPCRRVGDEWRNARTQEAIQADVIGWCIYDTLPRSRTRPG